MINRVKAAWKFITSPNYSRTVGILALLVVVLAIPLTVFIAQKQQEIRQRAQTIGSCRNLHPNDTVPPSVDGRGNAIDPNKYYWRALNCSESCFVTDDTSDAERYNSKCAKNTLDPSVNAATSNWCYRFDEGNYRCLQLRSIAQPSDSCNANISCDAKAVNRLDPNNDLSCRKIGNNDTAGVYTGGDYQWIAEQKGKDLCSAQDHRGRTARCGGQIFYCDPLEGRPGNWVTTPPQAPQQVSACGQSCTVANNSGTTNPSQCTGNKYLYIQTDGYPSGQCGTACLPCPANTKPSDDKCSCVIVPTLTPTPKPVQLCGFDCKSFNDRDSIKSEEGCTNEGYYIEKVSYDYNTQKCDFRCSQIPDYGTINRRKANGCGYEAISKPAPPSGGGGDGGGDGGGGAPAPGPGAPAPQPGEPTGALTKLLFDLILPQGSKDKRVVAQIFTATPAAQIGEDLEGTVKRGPGGNYTGTVDVVNAITPGTYDIKVKAGKYLRKLIKDVQITQDTTTRISQITLTLGDINDDNKLNIADYNILIDCFGAKANSQTCGNNNKDLADLDDNGRVDGVDYNLFLISLSKGPREGD